MKMIDIGFKLLFFEKESEFALYRKQVRLYWGEPDNRCAKTFLVSDKIML